MTPFLKPTGALDQFTWWEKQAEREDRLAQFLDQLPEGSFGRYLAERNALDPDFILDDSPGDQPTDAHT
jgi:hypothetical protein